jgi:lipoate-protein ligase B
MPLLQSFPPEMTFAESERGGDLTYHGPGQLVFYPICKLDGKGFAPNHDVAGFLRKLETLLIQNLSQYGLTGSVHENATGVWLGTKKIASIGIAIRKWVSYHGVALNCVNDLKPFHLISPCGFHPEVMTRLSDWVPLNSQWRSEIEQSLAQLFLDSTFLVEVESLSLEAAFQRCSEIPESIQSISP